jgi:NADH-quinone oxidoreductase subunit J
LDGILDKVTEALATFGPALMFYGLAAVVVGFAAYAVAAKKIDHSAFALMASFSAVAGIYALLGSDFLAVTQVVVYVGGIMVLIVFGVLLTDRLPLEFRQVSRVTVLQGLAVAVPAFLGLLWAISGTRWPGGGSPPGDEGTTRGIGELLMTEYLFPFELASIVLLVALIGAARLARGGRS